MPAMRKPNPIGRRTAEQNRRIVNREENTKGTDLPTPGETIAEARKKHPSPPAAYDISTGNRSIKRGAHQETEHNKNRSG